MGNDLEEFIDAIIQIDNSKDYNNLFKFIVENIQYVNNIVYATYRLLNEKRTQAAYIIATILSKLNVHHPVLQFSLAVGGITFGNIEDETNGIALLGPMTAALTDEQQALFYAQIVSDPIFRLTESALIAGDDDRLMRILEILRAGSPRLRQIFDLSRQEAPLDLEVLRKRGRERAKLIEFVSPPTGRPRLARRVILAARDRVFPQNPNSRPHEIGPRLTWAMNAYGWNTTFVPMKWINFVEECQAVIETCREEQADLLVFDDQVIESQGYLAVRASMIAHLRYIMPNLKIVVLYLDAWSIDSSFLVAAGTAPDAIWTMTPSRPVWDHPSLAGRVMQVPFPLLGDFVPPPPPASFRMTFTGAIQAYNWHRVFWRAAALRANLPVEWSVSQHLADGLSALDSHAAYMRRLGASGCSLNLSMRPNMDYIVTGRVFETILSGALLVQELCPDMDYYFISGEHYLEFTTFADLRAIGDFLTANPGAAEEIRCAGNAFARAHYSDDKVIGYLDNHLFQPAP